MFLLLLGKPGASLYLYTYLQPIHPPTIRSDLHNILINYHPHRTTPILAFCLGSRCEARDQQAKAISSFSSKAFSSKLWTKPYGSVYICLLILELDHHCYCSIEFYLISLKLILPL